MAPSTTGGARNHATSPAIGASLECDGNLPDGEIQPHRPGGLRRDVMADDPRRTEYRVAGKGNLPRRGEDSHTVSVVMLARRPHEGRFRVIRFRRDLLHRLVGQVICADHDRELIPGVGAFREDIDDVEASRHGLRRHTYATLSASGASNRTAMPLRKVF